MKLNWIFKMAKIRKLEDMYVVQIPGENSWKNAKRFINNFYFKGDLFGGKFMMNVSTGYRSPGFVAYVDSKNDLEKRFNFIEKNHLQEKKVFEISFQNIYFSEIDVKEEIKIKKEVYELI